MALGPYLGATRSLGQARRHANAVPGAPEAAVQQIVCIELVRDTHEINVGAAEDETRMASDDGKPSDP